MKKHELSNNTLWSNKIRERRTTSNRHLLRIHKRTPAPRAFNKIYKTIVRRRGQPKRKEWPKMKNLILRTSSEGVAAFVNGYNQSVFWGETPHFFGVLCPPTNPALLNPPNSVYNPSTEP